MQRSTIKKIIEALGAILPLYAVFTQYYIRLHKPDIHLSFLDLTWNHFSFFTILTNLLVAVYFINMLFTFSKTMQHKQFSTAVLLYILTVGIVFNLLLRKLYHPSGIEGVNNNLLHVFIPLLMAVYWVFFIRKQRIPYASIGTWLIYPVLYSAYVQIKGHFNHFYQYPFFDTDTLGPLKVFQNFSGLLFMSILFSMALIWVNNKWLVHRNSHLNN